MYLCTALNEPWAALFFLFLIQGRQAEGRHSRLDVLLFRAIKEKERQGTVQGGLDELCFQKELIEHTSPIWLTGWQRCTSHFAVSTIWITAFPLLFFPLSYFPANFFYYLVFPTYFCFQPNYKKEIYVLSLYLHPPVAFCIALPVTLNSFAGFGQT